MKPGHDVDWMKGFSELARKVASESRKLCLVTDDDRQWDAAHPLSASLPLSPAEQVAQEQDPQIAQTSPPPSSQQQHSQQDPQRVQASSPSSSQQQQQQHSQQGPERAQASPPPPLQQLPQEHAQQTQVLPPPTSQQQLTPAAEQISKLENCGKKKRKL